MSARTRRRARRSPRACATRSLQAVLVLAVGAVIYALLPSPLPPGFGIPDPDARTHQRLPSPSARSWSPAAPTEAKKSCGRAGEGRGQARADPRRPSAPRHLRAAAKRKRAAQTRKARRQDESGDKGNRRRRDNPAPTARRRTKRAKAIRKRKESREGRAVAARNGADQRKPEQNTSRRRDDKKDEKDGRKKRPGKGTSWERRMPQKQAAEEQQEKGEGKGTKRRRTKRRRTTRRARRGRSCWPMSTRSTRCTRGRTCSRGRGGASGWSSRRGRSCTRDLTADWSPATSDDRNALVQRYRINSALEPRLLAGYRPVRLTFPAWSSGRTGDPVLLAAARSPER